MGARAHISREAPAIGAKVQVRYKFLPWSFFVAGLGMMTGRVGQQASIYLFLFIIPIWTRAWRSVPQRDLVLLAFSALGVYFVFDVMDVVHLLSVGGYTIKSSNWNKSKFSTLLGISALLLLLLSFVVRKKGSSEVDPILRRGQALRYWTDGVLVGSLLLTGFGVIQFLTGFDFADVSAYRADRILASGFHRIGGLSSHPLSLAGMSLAIMGVFASLSLSQTFSDHIGREKSILPLLSALGPRGQSLLIMLLHGALVTMSGSRTATALGGLLFAGVVCLYAIRNWHRGWIKIAALGSLGCLGAGLYFSGFIRRVEEAFHTNQGGDQRIFFWQVHWEMVKSSPLIGHGRYYLENFAREETYVRMFGSQNVEHYNAHNIYLEVLAMGGILGLAFLATASLWFLWRLRKVSRLSLGGSALFNAFVVAVAANLLHGLTQNTFFDSAVLSPYTNSCWMIIWLSLLPADIEATRFHNPLTLSSRRADFRRGLG